MLISSKWYGWKDIFAFSVLKKPGTSALGWCNTPIICKCKTLVKMENILSKYNGEKMWKPYYDICNCTTKSIVYPYSFHIISFLWKYTIIIDNQNSFYIQWSSIQFPFYDLLWIFKFFISDSWLLFERELEKIKVQNQIIRIEQNSTNHRKKLTM